LTSARKGTHALDGLVNRKVVPDAEVRRLLLQLRLARFGDESRMTLRNVRRAWQLCVKAFASRQPVAEVRQFSIPSAGRELPLRIYFGSAPGPSQPVIVWFHGGGFVFGDLYTAGATCRAIASRTGAVVVAVDYSLVPECTIEAARADCLVALRWVSDHADEIGADRSRLVVGGDSAGGTLAALVAHDCRHSSQLRLMAQLLLYPATDLASDRVFVDESIPMLTAGRIAWLRRQVAKVSDDQDPKLSPVRQVDLARLPLTIMVTAGFDPLRDEGLAYARMLTNAGVPVRVFHYPGQFHGFISFDRVLIGGIDALDRVCRELGKAFVGDSPEAGIECISISLRQAMGRMLWLRPKQRWNEAVVACLLFRGLSRR
jgi:acetyl esterase